MTDSQNHFRYLADPREYCYDEEPAPCVVCKVETSGYSMLQVSEEGCNTCQVCGP